MFEQFTQAARFAMIAAHDTAREFRHAHIGTEHLLIGLLAQPETLAAQTLSALGISQASLRNALIDRIGTGPQPTGHIPFTDDLTSTLERSINEAHAHQHSHVDTEHLLLALLSQPDGLGIQILASQVENLTAVRARMAGPTA